MNKALFLKLIKTWHPDTTTCARKKAIFEEMSRHILQANSDGDGATLEEIDRIGEAYLETVKNREAEEEEERRSDEQVREAYRRFVRMQQDEDTRGEWSYAYPIHPPRHNTIADYLYAILQAANPYLLTLSLRAWGQNGRIFNAGALISGMVWMAAFWKIWGLLGTLEIAAHASGYSHEGALGLLFVLARGTLILAALPIAFPLGLLAGVATVVVGFLFLIAWMLGGILCLFHPWLAYLPYAIATVILIGAAWEALGEDF